jgi:hypothetical protein
MVGGFVLGMGGFLCSTIALGSAAAADLDGEGAGTELGVSLGCLAAGMVGFGLMASGMPYMYDAINMYNDSVEGSPAYAPAPGPPGSAFPPTR